MKKQYKYVYFYFILLPFIDVITSLNTRLSFSPISIGVIVKGLTLLLLTIYSLFFSKSKYKKKTILYYSLVGIFAVLYVITKIDIWSISFFKEEIIYAVKYFYFPLTFLGLLNLFDDWNIEIKTITNILLVNCITYSFLLFIPYITNSAFNSYSNPLFAGYNGWFFAANETGVIMTILLSSIYYLIDKENKWKIIIALPMMYILSLIGTKVAFLGLISITLLILLINVIKNKKFGIITSGLLLVFLAISCYASPTADNFILSYKNNFISVNTDPKGNVNNINQIEPIIINNTKTPVTYKYNAISDITNNELIQKGLNLVLSGRADFFLKNYSIYEASGIKNQLFGLGWVNRDDLNYNFTKKVIEIDILDILIHYGIIGFLIYFIPLVYFLLKVVLEIKKWKIETLFYIGILCLVLFISLLAGHTLSAPAVSIYIILIMIIIQKYLDNNKKTEEEI